MSTRTAAEIWWLVSLVALSLVIGSGALALYLLPCLIGSNFILLLPIWARISSWNDLCRQTKTCRSLWDYIATIFFAAAVTNLVSLGILVCLAVVTIPLIAYLLPQPWSVLLALVTGMCGLVACCYFQLGEIAFFPERYVAKYARMPSYAEYGRQILKAISIYGVVLGGWIAVALCVLRVLPVDKATTNFDRWTGASSVAVHGTLAAIAGYRITQLWFHELRVRIATAGVLVLAVAAGSPSDAYDHDLVIQFVLGLVATFFLIALPGMPWPPRLPVKAAPQQ